MKAHDFFPQISRKRLSDVDFISATRTLIGGYFLKVFVADNLAQYTVSLAYRHQWEQLGSDVLLAMLIGYSAQIFADFAGYSLIALGVAELFGYQLIQNFNFPYIATSFSEFWKRWHISLSTWLREYMYFSLGGNRRGRIRTYINLMIVMGLGGLWHGAEWKYAVWGVWHGGALAIERGVTDAFGKLNERYHWHMTERAFVKVLIAMLRWVLVFSVVTIGWLFFSLESIGDILPYIIQILEWSVKGNGQENANVIILYTLASIIAIYHIYGMLTQRFSVVSLTLEPYALGLMLWLTVFYSGPAHAFIYFQF